MPATAHRSNAADEPEVVKWYTRARRFPQLIGKTPSGGSIWGGPYTYTQVALGVGLIVAGSKTTSLWGHFGLIGNTLALFGATYGLVLLVGRLPIGSRNPLAVGAGALRAIGSPPRGTLAGRQVRLRRVHRARSRLVINHDAPTLSDAALLPAPATPPSRPGTRPEPAILGAPPPSAPTTSTPRPPRSRPRSRLPWPRSATSPAGPAPSPQRPGTSHAAGQTTTTATLLAAPTLTPLPPGRSTRTTKPAAAPAPLTRVQQLLASTGLTQLPPEGKD